MNKETLITFIEQGLSSHKIAKEIGKSQCSVRYWLNKHQLKTKHLPNKGNKKDWSQITESRCPLCKASKPIEDFYAKDGGKPYPYCKNCSNKRTVQEQRDRKRRAVEYKGGRCYICGYDKYIGALEFHHIDPTKKDFNLSQLKNYALEFLKPELDKCVCLCANCHREVHGKIVALPLEKVDSASIVLASSDL